MTSTAIPEQIDLALAIHEAAHAVAYATQLPDRPGADRITIHCGTDARGFYAECNGYWRNNDGSMRKMPFHPLGVCAGPAATALFDPRVQLTRHEALRLGAGLFPALAHERVAIAPDDWEQAQAMGLSPAVLNAHMRAALLMCITFETLILTVGRVIERQLVTEGLPVAEVCPVFLRQHVTGVANLINLGSTTLFYSSAEVCQHLASEIGKAAAVYTLALAKPFTEAVQ
ncbi:hypothetical protein [Salipiger mangrovisoli]|uniref:Uncharacterized protein n=1 Tax=Salipiger mangrovisoli TaxID=2865933 RepID=A0ABR9X3W8_9RHOB|nr:hypothetical protein [Salipiger mangrovisoli]MBE9638275.1 hypothetical protein [Salipiger mangrovisoli]